MSIVVIAISASARCSRVGVHEREREREREGEGERERERESERERNREREREPEGERERALARPGFGVRRPLASPMLGSAASLPASPARRSPSERGPRLAASTASRTSCARDRLGVKHRPSCAGLGEAHWQTISSAGRGIGGGWGLLDVGSRWHIVGVMAALLSASRSHTPTRWLGREGFRRGSEGDPTGTEFAHSSWARGGGDSGGAGGGHSAHTKEASSPHARRGLPQVG